MPTSENLLIIVNGNIVTNKIQPGSITIINERGKRVSSATFTIDDGADLGIAQWQTVAIYEADMSVTHFNGFIMEPKSVKRGVFVDYTLECSSIEVLLQRAIVNGTFSGTDDEILAAMLAGAYPDLSDMFDWASGITPLLTTDMNIDFQDLNLLDALDMLSARVDNAPYDQGYGAAVARINLIRNPALTNNMTRYGSTLIEGTIYYNNYSGTWNPANTVYNSSGGESDGGIEITSQTLGVLSQEHGYWRIGRDLDATDLNTTFRVERGDNKWLALRFRVSTTSAAARPLQILLVTYDDDGNIYDTEAQLDAIGVGPGWDDWSEAWDMSDAAIFPVSGWAEFTCKIDDSTTKVPFVTYVDKFLMEVVYDDVSEPDAGAYFDGNTADAYWDGTADDSTSTTGGNKLTWGTSPDAAFDLDIDSGSEIFDDFQIDFPGLDSINSVIVTGGYEWEAVDWIYEGTGERDHWDLELIVYPQETFAQPIIYRNTGTDEAPNWVSQTVATRQEGFAAGNVLYDLEGHWVQFQSATVALAKSWRIVGRIKKRIRTIVTDDVSVAATGQEFTDTIYNENIDSASAAYDLGQSEITRRAASPLVKFTTYEPGLIAGAEIDIADSVQSFDETLIIQRVTRTYLGGGKGKFAVEAGRLPIGIDDILGETHDLAEPKVPVPETPDTLTVATLVDDDAIALVDDDAIVLIDVEVS